MRVLLVFQACTQGWTLALQFLGWVVRQRHPFHLAVQIEQHRLIVSIEPEVLAGIDLVPMLFELVVVLLHNVFKAVVREVVENAVVVFYNIVAVIFENGLHRRECLFAGFGLAPRFLHLGFELLHE